MVVGSVTPLSSSLPFFSPKKTSFLVLPKDQTSLSSILVLRSQAPGTSLMPSCQKANSLEVLATGPRAGCPRMAQSEIQFPRL